VSDESRAGGSAWVSWREGSSVDVWMSNYQRNPASPNWSQAMKRAALASAVLVIMISVGAHARDLDPNALIARGLELRRAGKSAEALELFRRAHRQAPSARTLGQMGLVETSLDRWIDADADLSASLATPDDAWVRQNRPFLDQALARTKEHVGELVISGRPGTQVVFAGKALGALPLAAPLRAAEGDFELTATAAEFIPFSKVVSVKGGARTAVAIVLEPTEVAAPSTPMTESFSVAQPPRSPFRRKAGLALAAGGVGLLTWGIAWIAIDSRDACGSSRSGSCRVYDTRTAGWILTASGAALALTGGALLYFTIHAPTTHAPTAEVALGFMPSSLLLEGRF
jgi:hypothetical protein